MRDHPTGDRPANPTHQRRSIRLRGYDYSQSGAYFLTICTHQRENLFGQIVEGSMQLNQSGTIVREEWEKSALIRAEIELGEFIIMPNHFHAIVYIVGDDPCRGERPPSCTGERPFAPTTPPFAPTQKQTISMRPKSIGSLVAGFKSSVTTRINQHRGTPRAPEWQRSYYEHIIRDEKSNVQIAKYILNNPLQWQTDELYSG